MGYEAGQKGNFTLRVLSHKEVHVSRIDKIELPATAGHRPKKALNVYAAANQPFVPKPKPANEDTLERSCVIIKPDALTLSSAESILAIIEDFGELWIVQQEQFELERD